MLQINSNLMFGLIAGSIFMLLVAFIIVVLVIRYRQKQFQNQRRIKELNHNYEQQLLQAQVEIQEQTLLHISEEIHDNIGQALSLAKLNLNTFPVMPDEESQMKVLDTKQIIGKAINDLRHLSRSLHGDKISEIGLREAVENEVRMLKNSGQYAVDCSVTGDSYSLDPKKEMILFRIIQEVLNNIVRHAAAQSISIKMNYETTRFFISIADDGMGFDARQILSSDTGIGFKNMRNRASVIGADINIDSAVNKGTCITLSMLK